MKLILTALGGGIVGAVMVLAVQAGGINIINPATAGSVSARLDCYILNMEHVNTQISGHRLDSYCQSVHGGRL